MITKFKNEVMKNIFFPITGLIIITTILISCGQQSKTADNQPKKEQAKTKPETLLLLAYLDLKNALIADDANAAAKSGNQLLVALDEMYKSSATTGKSS